MNINLKKELNDFTDWLNEEKGQIFTIFTEKMISWTDHENECDICVRGDRMVASEHAQPYIEEYTEWVPGRTTGRQSDIEDYLSGHDELVSIIQNSITDFILDKMYDIPADAFFVHDIQVTMTSDQPEKKTEKMTLTND